MKIRPMNFLIEKYNVPAPRYTSYPTVPFWERERVSQSEWLQSINRSFTSSNKDKGISVYIHLPFCESLCTYCACNTRITKNHKVEETYIKALLTEWQIYLDSFGSKPIIRELHLGGGTPTFFSAENLENLISRLLENCNVHSETEFSFEGHPNNTEKGHLQALYDVGFRRVSYGVQDLDEKVQSAINRLQPFENVEKATRLARKVGYTSVNFDLIYGLPYQTLESVSQTINQVLLLRPDRIAYYSYAHVPWLKPGQRSYTEKDLPDNDAKRALYETGKQLLIDHGYEEVGMDHFTLKTDELFRAKNQGWLHRNFMGYTTSQTEVLIGLGASSIGDSSFGYAQNEKKVEDYQNRVFAGELPLTKGHFLSEEDLLTKRAILQLSCNGVVDWDLIGQVADKRCIDELIEMELERLIHFRRSGLHISRAGKPFVRNICMVFDRYLHQTYGNEEVFSKAI